MLVSTSNLLGFFRLTIRTLRLPVTFTAPYSTNNKMPYYAVARGKNTGIYNDWLSCEANVKGVPNSRYKKFSTREAASAFVKSEGGSSSSSSLARGGGFGGSSSAKSSYGSSSKASSGGPFGSLISSSATSHGSRYRGSSYGGVTKPTPKPTLKPTPKTVEIYVDGASRGNSSSRINASGIGIYYGEGDSRNRGIAMSEVDNVSKNAPTNQRAELAAMRYALQGVNKAQQDGDKSKYTIVSDSQYAIKSVTEWSKNWEKNGWKNSKNEPVANKDLVQECTSLLSKTGGSVSFRHVRGHRGDPGNEAADRLANQGADRMSGSS